MFARSYNPQAIPGVVKAWKAELEDNGKSKLAATIADPETDADLFEEGWGGGSAGDEGSGVMVEKEDTDGDDEEDKGVVNGLVEKVKDLTVGNGNGTQSSSGVVFSLPD